MTFTFNRTNVYIYVDETSIRTGDSKENNEKADGGKKEIISEASGLNGICKRAESPQLPSDKTKCLCCYVF